MPSMPLWVHHFVDLLPTGVLVGLAIAVAVVLLARVLLRDYIKYKVTMTALNSTSKTQRESAHRILDRDANTARRLGRLPRRRTGRRAGRRLG